VNETTFKSKVYFPPSKKDYILVVLINLCVIFAAIYSIFSIVNNGVKIGNISTIIISLFVSIAISKKSNIRGHYDFSLAQLSSECNKLKIHYLNFSQIISFDIDQIIKIEFSDKLSCFRIVGNCLISNSKETVDNKNEWLIYINDDSFQIITEEIEKITSKNVIYVDR